MVIVQRHGQGERWYCEKCDQWHNGYLNMITWTNSTAPLKCDRCGDETTKAQEARDAADELKKIYGDRFYLPGSVDRLVNLMKRHHIRCKNDLAEVARVMNVLFGVEQL